MIPHTWDLETQCCRVCGSETQNNNCRDDVIGITWLRRRAVNLESRERAGKMAVALAYTDAHTKAHDEWFWPPQGEGA